MRMKSQEKTAIRYLTLYCTATSRGQVLKRLRCTLRDEIIIQKKVGRVTCPVQLIIFENSVADPVPNPDPDPQVFGLLDPDPLVRGMDPAPDSVPSIIKQI
jgi:hypothetical protein